MELIDSQGHPQDQLVAYIKKVLDALGMKKGPAHAELFFTRDGIAVLIEENFRIMGLSIPNSLQEEALTHTQINATADVYSDAKKFLENTAPYKLKKHLVCVMHQVTKEGCVFNEAAVDRIKALNSFAMHKCSKKSGETVSKTTDLINSIGWVLLISDSMEQINQDIELLRKIEQNYLFVEAHQLNSSINVLQIDKNFIAPRSGISDSANAKQKFSLFSSKM